MIIGVEGLNFRRTMTYHFEISMQDTGQVVEGQCLGWHFGHPGQQFLVLGVSDRKMSTIVKLQVIVIKRNEETFKSKFTS